MLCDWWTGWASQKDAGLHFHPTTWQHQDNSNSKSLQSAQGRLDTARTNTTNTNTCLWFLINNPWPSILACNFCKVQVLPESGISAKYTCKIHFRTFQIKQMKRSCQMILVHQWRPLVTKLCLLPDKLYGFYFWSETFLWAFEGRAALKRCCIPAATHEFSFMLPREKWCKEQNYSFAFKTPAVKAELCAVSLALAQTK